MNIASPSSWSSSAPLFTTSSILDNSKIAEATFRITLHAPELAKKMLPGQFAMLRIADQNEAILGRAFAMWDRTVDAGGQPENIQFVYLVKGRMTSRLARLGAGATINVWGPLGNGFSNQPIEHLILVAGGVGQTPMLTLGLEALGRQQYGSPVRSNGFAKHVTLYYGARSESYLAGLSDFDHAGIELIIATEDGSRGHRGRVTEPLTNFLNAANRGSAIRIACCGPEPMMETVARTAIEHNVPCDVSLETPMACGIGICFSCVAKIKQPDGLWDYRRTCVEGPVFDAALVCW